jgi:hypothetical protein
LWDCIAERIDESREKTAVLSETGEEEGSDRERQK